MCRQVAWLEPRIVLLSFLVNLRRCPICVPPSTAAHSTTAHRDVGAINQSPSPPAGVTLEQGALNAIDTAACAQPGQTSVTTNTGSLATAISSTSSPSKAQLRQHLLRRRTPCRCAHDRHRLHCVNPDVLFRLHHSNKLHCSPKIVCFGHNCLGCSWCSCHPSILAQTRDRLIDAPASNCRCCSR